MGATILVVEDEPAIQELISVNLRHAGHNVLQADRAEAAKACLQEQVPDLVLLDWMLPDGSGLSLARALRAEPRTREVPIIMLTARSGEADKVAGLDAGADDYVTKPFSPRELLSRIRAVLRRRAPHSTDDPVEVGGLVLDPSTRRVSAGGSAIPLGPTEFRLLHFLMTHPRRVYSRTQLLDQVWGDHVFIEERTVDVHVKRLRETLAPVDAGRMIETVRGAGYLMPSRPPGVDAQTSGSRP